MKTLLLTALVALAATASARPGAPTRLRMKALNSSAAVINMTDDISFGTLSWSPKERYVFDDDVRIDGTLTVGKIINKELNEASMTMKRILDCNENMELYDATTGGCAVVSSRTHNERVREPVTGNSYFFCLIMWDNSLRCWGWAGSYSMQGFSNTNERYWPTESPVTFDIKLQTRRGYHKARMLPAAYTYYNMGAVLADGSVWMVGYGGHGVNGYGSTSNRPYFVKTNYLTNVTSLIGGGHTTEGTYCAIEGDGVLYCWGYNNAGQCGVGHTSSVKVPTRVLALTDVKMMDITRSSTSSSCAVRHDGTVWCWGYNGYGQLANGGTGNRDSPTQVGSSVTLYLEDVDYLKMHGGSVTTVIALKKDGTVWAWGYSGHGQTGSGSTSQRNRAVQVLDSSSQPLLTVADIFTTNGCRYGPICAIRDDGTVWCWGYNNHGQLGLGHTSSRDRAYKITTFSEPVRTLNIPPMIDHSYAYHSVCAITLNTKSVWCWGYNNYGQLGQGDTSQRNSPVKVRNIGRTSMIGARAYHSSHGDTTFYAVSEDGYEVWAWGYGGHGQPGSHSNPIGTNRIPQQTRLT